MQIIPISRLINILAQFGFEASAMDDGSIYVYDGIEGSGVNLTRPVALEASFEAVTGFIDNGVILCT